MRFEVIGENAQTGAREKLEIEAANKADAEKKGREAGLHVNTVRQAGVVVGVESNRQPAATKKERAAQRDRGEFDHPAGKRRTGLHPLLKLVIAAAVLGVGVYLMWGTLRGMLKQ
jgi:hypothetical protein